jgi:hypothetical protein
MMDGGTMFDNIEKQRATARVVPTATVVAVGMMYGGGFDVDFNILTA